MLPSEPEGYGAKDHPYQLPRHASPPLPTLNTPDLRVSPKDSLYRMVPTVPETGSRWTSITAVTSTTWICNSNVSALTRSVFIGFPTTQTQLHSLQPNNYLVYFRDPAYEFYVRASSFNDSFNGLEHDIKDTRVFR
jgi:hypothetical protein